MSHMYGSARHHRVVPVRRTRRPADPLKNVVDIDTETETCRSPGAMPQRVTKVETRAETSSSRLPLAAQGVLGQFDRGQAAVWERITPSRPLTARVTKVDLLLCLFCLFLRPAHDGYYR